MEAAGILVVVNGVVGNNTHRRLDPNEFRGFVLVDEYAPLVFVNGADARAAQMFTLAHELAHVFIGRDAAFDLHSLLPASDIGERACDGFAAEFLVPAERLWLLWAPYGRRPDRLDELARAFKVSQIVIARRALDLGLMTRDAFLEFYKSHIASAIAGKPHDQGGNFYLTQDLRIGRRFTLAVIQALGEGRLTYSEAYSLTGLHGITFEKYSAHLTEPALT